MSEIQRLESILASPFWGSDEKRCVLEEVTFEIAGRDGDYHWRFVDGRDSSYAKSDRSYSDSRLAKAAMRSVVEAGLTRHRAKSTHS